MSKPTLYKAGRVVVLEFPTNKDAENFTLDDDGKDQKIRKLKITKKILLDRAEDLEKQIKDLRKEIEETENKNRYLENQLQQKNVECAFLKGEEPPANEEVNFEFEEGEFEEDF